MPLRPCLDCGTPTPGTRCPPCRRTRHTTKYPANHRTTRAAWAPAVATGQVICPRCSLPIRGEYDLGHQDDGTLHPEHPRCNRAAH